MTGWRASPAQSRATSGADRNRHPEPLDDVAIRRAAEVAWAIRLMSIGRAAEPLTLIGAQSARRVVAADADRTCLQMLRVGGHRAAPCRAGGQPFAIHWVISSLRHLTRDPSLTGRGIFPASAKRYTCRHEQSSVRATA
jgi:hypothetical protein